MFQTKMRMRPSAAHKFALSVFAAVLTGLSAQALVVDRDMTITTAPSGIEFAGDYTLTISGNMYTSTITNNGHKAVVRLDGGNVQISWVEATNGSYTRIEFNGGVLTDAGNWSSPWFKPDATSTIELASIDGKPISIQHPNSQWKYLVSGQGRLITTGDGKLEIATSSVYNGTVLYCYVNVPATNFMHTGGTVFRGNTPYTLGNVRFDDPQCLPSGEIRLGEANGLYPCLVSLGTTTQNADRIIGYGVSSLTNCSKTATTLVFTNDNSCLDAVITGPSFNVSMRGSSASDVFTLKTAKVSGMFSVEAGKAVVQKPRVGEGTSCGQLRLANGTVLEVDGVAMTVGTFMNEGGQIIYKNGGTLTVLQQVDETSRIEDSNGFRVSGASSFVKSGAGTLYLAGGNLLDVSECHVAEGAMKFVGALGTTNHWWRFTVRQSAKSGGTLSIGPMRLLDANCDFADGAGTGNTGGGYSAVAAGTAVTQYKAKQYSCSSSDYYKGAKVGSDNPVGRNALWYSSTVYDCTFNSPKPKESDPSTWITWTYRIPDPGVTILGYNLKTQWGTLDNWPRSWILESSPSGADGTWEMMDERSNYTAITQGQQWYNGGGYGVGGMNNHPSTKINFDSQGIPKSASKGGVAAGTAVRVDRGATLDCSQCEAQQELSALTVDCAEGTGVGTLMNVKLAATGTIRLVNATGKSGITLPLAFVDSVTTGSLDGWKVYVNGVESPKFSLAWQDGQLVIPNVGLLILLK